MPERQVSLFLGEGLMHVDIAPGLLSTWKFWRAIDRLPAEREK